MTWGFIKSTLLRGASKKHPLPKFGHNRIVYFEHSWKIINYALSSASSTVIIPLQDILGENSSGRFNVPGTISSDNWSWRMEEDKLTESLKTKLAELTKSHKRNSATTNNPLKEELESWKQ